MDGEYRGGPFKVEAFRNMPAQRLDIYVGSNVRYWLPAQITTVVVTENDEGSLRQPTFTFTVEMAQNIFDSLWSENFRPTGWKDPEIKVVDADVVRRHHEEVSRLNAELQRERNRLTEAEKRLDRALELAGHFSHPRRMNAKNRSGTKEQDVDGDVSPF